MLEVMYVKVMITMQTDKIVLVALMIAKEEILTMYGSVILPPFFCFLYAFTLRVIVISKRNIVFT